MNRGAKSDALLAANVAIRVGYGLGGLLAPTAMAKLRLAAEVGDRPEARLFVRGFSAHQIGVGGARPRELALAGTTAAGRCGRGGDRCG